MWNIKSESFWEKLNPGFQNKVSEFVGKHLYFTILEKIQLYVSIAGVIYFLTPFGRGNMVNITRKLNLNSSMSVYIAFIAVGVFYALMEAIIEPIKKSMEKIWIAMKDRMIVKVCTCEGYCECKEDFNIFMEQNGVKLLS